MSSDIVGSNQVPGRTPSIAPDGELDPLTMGGYLAELTNRHHDEEVFLDDGVSWTYGEFGLRVHEIARGLVGVGVTKGTRVGILMGNRPEWVAATFGAALVGAIAVPMSTFATVAEREHMMRHSDVAILLTQATLLNRDFVSELTSTYLGLAEGAPGPFFDERLPNLRRIFCLGLEAAHGAIEPWQALLSAGSVVPSGVVRAMAANVSPVDDGLIQYTSGSTSLPKAVLHYQRSVPIKLREYAEAFGLRPGDRVLAPQQYFWAFAQVPGAALAGGASIVCMERFDGPTALDWIEKYRITVVQPAGYQVPVLAELAAVGAHDLSSLRFVAKAGFTPTRELEEKQWFVSGYGLTENLTAVATHRYDDPIEVRRASNGQPHDSVTVEIIDPVTGEPLPTGQEGEIAIKGLTLMRGYYKMAPEECFDERGFYRTKDMGFLDEAGYLHYVGRASTMIKTSGANVSPTEVQEALYSSGLVAVSAVVGLPHPIAGEAVVALVALKDGIEATEAQLRAHVKSTISSYKVPRRFVIVGESEIPTTGSGKIDFGNSRRAVSRLLIETSEDAAWVALLKEKVLASP